jgi:hypothetical protein
VQVPPLAEPSGVVYDDGELITVEAVAPPDADDEAVAPPDADDEAEVSTD